MKGTKETLLRNLIYIILVPLLLLVCFGMLTPITRANLMEEITGKKPVEIVQVPEKQNPFPLSWVEHVIGSGDAYQLSEVACEIAGKINDDFMANLYDNPRQVGQGSNCERDWCIINNGVGRFRLSSTTNVNQPTDSVIPGARTAFTEKKCSICEEPQGNGNLIENLDEVCINYNLNTKNPDLCSGPIIVGGKITEFGNSDCGNQRNGNTWQSHCDNDGNIDFCDDHDKYDKILWDGDKTKYNNAYLTVEDSNEIINFDISVRWWKSNSVILNKESNEYMYGILWDFNNERYEILFEQIPIIFTTSDKTDLDNIPNNLTAESNFRVNRLGNWYTEAREIEHFIFTPTTDVSFQTFYSSLGEKVGIESCNDKDDCFYTKPQKRDSANCADPSFAYIWDDIVIRSNKPMLEDFKAGKTYEISVKNWVGYYFAKVGWAAIISPNSACYDYFDRTISIYEQPVIPPLPPLTCDEIDGTCVDADLCEAGGGYCDGLRGCTGGECCCT
jgi:hypothetical protein